MTTAQIILKHLMALPDAAQREVLDFVEFLEIRQQKTLEKEEDVSWSDLSLASAMRGMEDEEPLYTFADIKESL